MVTTRGGSKPPSADLTQRTKPRRFPKTDNTAISPMIVHLPPKGSTAAIANDSAAPEPPGLPEPHSDGHEHANTSGPDNANGILDAEVDADGKTINAETHVVEESATNVSGQDATKTWGAINDAETIPPGSVEPSLGPIVPGDVSCSSVKQGLTPSGGPHLSKAQRPAKRQKTVGTKDGRSVMHAQSLIHTPEADSSPASPSLSSERHPASKKSKSLLKRKRSTTKHVTAPGDNPEENQYRRCKKTAFQAQIDKENLWMNSSMEYTLEALKYNDALSKLYEENAVTHKKRRNELDGSSEKQRKTIIDQGDILERCINHIVLCGARELNFTRRWGGI